MHLRSFCVGSVLAVLGGVRVAAALVTPLPLPDCAANNLPIDDNAVCEGGNVGYIQGWPADLRYTPIPLQISTRNVDFRRDEDLGGPQIVTFTLAAQGTLEGPGLWGANSVIRTAVKPSWPLWLEDSIVVDRRDDDPADPGWSGGNVGSAEIPGHSGLYALFVRVGDCAGTSCAYRVNWAPYPNIAVRQSNVYRVCLSWTQNYIFKLGGPYDYGQSDGANLNTCGNALPNGCYAGGGTSCVTFGTDPPPKLVAEATATRIGSKQFRFDASTSGPDAEGYSWSCLNPVVHSNAVAFEHDFNTDTLAPNYTGNGMFLTVTDHWKRTAFTSADFQFLGGVEGPLEITSYELLGIANGVATLKAVVHNTSDKRIEHLFLDMRRYPPGPPIGLDPALTALDAHATVEITITVTVDTQDPIFVGAQALGTNDVGPVKSASKTRPINGPSGPSVRTTTSQNGQMGADRLEVASNDGFKVGDYVGIDPGPNAEVRRVDGFGSLIFSAPLSHPHDVGVSVEVIDPPGGDMTAPDIDVSVPAGGAPVCPSAPLQLVFTCSDGGVGVDRCGGVVASGQALDTNTPGAHTLAIDAWDWNGNRAAKMVSWTVAEGFAAARCALADFDAALAAAPTSDLTPKTKQKLAQLASRFRTSLDAVVAAGDAGNAKKRRKAVRAATRLASTLRATIDRGVKGKKIASPLGATLKGVIGRATEPLTT